MDLLTTTEAARLLRVTAATLHRWILSGQLPGSVRRGRRYLIPHAAVLAKLKTIAPSTPLDPRPPPAEIDRVTRAALARHGIKC